MSDRHVRGPTTAPDAVGRQIGLRVPSTRRLFWICSIGALSVLMGQSLLNPVLVGWYRAEEALALQDELDRLQGEHVALRAEIEYRRTPAGQELTAMETLLVTRPGGRLVELVPREPAVTSAPPPTLAERLEGWRREGGTWFYQKRRVLALLLLDDWLPAERPT